jgi:hypothetical protein
MPNTVPVAATGLPKMSRRNVVSALAVSSAIAAPALASAAVSPDAELLRLYGEWLAACKVRDAAMAENNRVDAILDAHSETIPEAARFRTDLDRRWAISDNHWDDLVAVTYGGPGTGVAREFSADAYDQLRDGLVRTDWERSPESSRYPEGSPHHWIAPYSPPLRARVEELIAAWEPWDAERGRLYEVHRANEVAAAYEDADARCMDLERAIAAMPAAGVDGYRVKATILALQTGFRSKVEGDLAAYVQQDRSHPVDGMRASLLLDLANWEAIS